MSTNLKRAPFDRHTHLLLKIWDDSNPAHVTNNMELDGKIKLNELIKLLDEKLLKFFRLRCRVDTKNGYFEEIPWFDCKANTTEIIVSNDISPTFEYVSKYILSRFNDKHLFDTNLPLWRVDLLQFKTKSHVLFIFHHCLLDGVTIFELNKILSGIDSNLTLNYKEPQRMGSLWNISNLYKYYPFNPLLFLNMFKPTLPYFANKINFLIPKDGLKGRPSVSMLEIPLNLISTKKQFMIKNKLWIKHSFGLFLLNILSETLFHFANNCLNIKKEQIPNEMSVTIPINLRPYFKDWEKQTIFGNIISGYFVTIPLDNSLDFNQRLKIIKKNHDSKINDNEPMFVNNLMKFESFLPKGLYQKFVSWGNKTFSTYLSGVKLYDVPKFNILGKNVEKCWGIFPNPPGLPLSVAYNAMRDKVTIMINIDVAVAGKNGADLFLKSMKYILNKYDCLAKQKSML